MSTTSNWIGVQTGVHGFDSRTPHKPVVSKNIWSRHLVKQLWPPDGCRRTEGRLSTTLAAKVCVLSAQQERSFKWDWSKWMMMKREMVDKQGESIVASHRCLGASNPGLLMLGSNEWDVSYQYGTRASFPVYQKDSCTLYSQA